MDQTLIYYSLKQTLDSYSPLSSNTWDQLKTICTIRVIKKKNLAFDIYDDAKYITYIYKGLFRVFSTNEKGEELNKNFFWENRFFGPMVALLKNTPISSAVEALEDSIVIDIDFRAFRKLLFANEDLKLFYIFYLEKHWLLDKDEDKYALVLENANQRYERFLQTFKHILPRISQQNIALYLGISPTHLSRIKKDLST